MDHLSDVHFGAVLRQMRFAAGLSQESLAERAGLSVRGISDLERGRRTKPRLETVRMLADALQLDDASRAELIEASRPGTRIHQTPGPLSPDGKQPAARINQYDLPHIMTGLVGRRREADEVASIIRRPDIRLLTLTGPGGIGKTKLALHVGKDLQEVFPDGVCFVPLVPIASAELVLPTIAESLHLREVDDTQLKSVLAHHLRDKELLLLLDNFEHVIDASPVVNDLLTMCSGLKVIVTSRVALRLRAEHLYEVMPLDLPESDIDVAVDDVSRFDALALFAARAGMADSRFTVTSATAPVIAAICRRLDGLPLAIELAASRIRSLPPSEMLRHLDHSLPVLTGGARDLPPHQQTLHRTIDWSYALLADRERELFRHLAVFAGGWTLESAAAVAGNQNTSWQIPEVADGIAELINHSLVRRVTTEDQTARFGMLLTIREYGLEQLSRHGEQAAALQRHATYFLTYIRQLGFDRPSHNERTRMRRVDAEYDNVRVALRWYIGQGDARSIQWLCAMLRSYWTMRGYFSEARGWIDEALALPDPAPGVERAGALYAAVGFACHQNNLLQAEQFAQECLELSYSIADDTQIATALLGLGLVAQLREDYPRASKYYEEGITLQRALGHPKLAVTLGNLAQVEFHQLRADRATALLDESIALDRAANDRSMMASHLTDLGLILTETGAWARAHRLFSEALAIHHAVGNVPKTIITLEGIAAAERGCSNPVRAATLYGAAHALREHYDYPDQAHNRWSHDDYIDQAREQLGHTAFASAWTTGESMSMDSVVDFALESLGEQL